ncbi:MAG: CoA-binding protein [Candidatus Methanolliviera sp. GoM_oil]|nr:MAG: CoA-binding protein [Candidatus Methanolliviera sp. GoM_oil]
MIDQEIKKLKTHGRKDNLSPFFEPKSVAIVGSLSQTWFGGQALLKNLHNFGYSGGIYLVNPSYEEVQDVKVYPSIKDIPESIDLVIIITPARTVLSIVKDCVKKGVKCVIIGADGFTERDEEGKRLQNEITEIARHTRIRIIGPNTVGTVNTATGLVTAIYLIGYDKIKKGGIAFVAQTGIIGPQAMPYDDWRYGISKICDLGNKCDVDESDLLEYLADDPETKVIAMHLECIKSGHRFLDVAKRAAQKKPILILKPGKTKESAKALMSHTGSLAGDQKIYESAFKQVGVIQVNSFKELLEIPTAFLCQPLPRGNRLGIITFTGGAGIMAMDIAAESGLTLAKLSTETNEKLSNIHPTLVGNPSDLGPLYAISGESPYKTVIEAMLNDENVDCIFCVIVGGFLSANLYIQTLNDIEKPKDKPMTFWVYGPSSESNDQVCFELRNNGYPVYLDIETAVKALGAMYRYKTIKNWRRTI